MAQASKSNPSLFNQGQPQAHFNLNLKNTLAPP